MAIVFARNNVAAGKIWRYFKKELFSKQCFSVPQWKKFSIVLYPWYNKNSVLNRKTSKKYFFVSKINFFVFPFSARCVFMWDELRLFLKKCLSETLEKEKY